MAKIKIVTDSTADIPSNIQKELGIEVIPLLIIHGDKEYKDGVDVTPEEFYKIMENSNDMPGSSCVPPIVYTELYERTYNEEYTDVILVTINAKGSSTNQNACMMRDMFYEEHPEANGKFNIHIIDSETYSIAYGWAVIEAARKANAGAGAEEIITGIKEWIAGSRILFLPMNLKYVKKSGRVSAAAAFVGDALGLKPVITFENGESKVVSKIRGEKTAAKSLVDLVEKDYKKGTPYMLAYGSNPEQFEKFRCEVTERLGREPELIFPIGSIICINSGHNMVGIIYQR